MAPGVRCGVLLVEGQGFVLDGQAVVQDAGATAGVVCPAQFSCIEPVFSGERKPLDVHCQPDPIDVAHLYFFPFLSLCVSLDLARPFLYTPVAAIQSMAIFSPTSKKLF